VKTRRTIIMLAVITIIFLSGCEVIGGALGMPYVFDTPTWIRGSWTYGTDTWIFTSTNVVHSESGVEFDFGQSVADGGGINDRKINLRQQCQKCTNKGKILQIR